MIGGPPVTMYPQINNWHYGIDCLESLTKSLHRNDV